MRQDPEVSRLRWRCRRGMKELDLLLGRYLESAYAAASSHERAVFARFLELPDPELAAYLLGGVTPAAPDFARLVHRVRGQDGEAATPV
ncbi:MAG: FAD assembly factor SdhE [Steroidobacteraceae bacterium]|nr:FAD assembly factor SdhE [Steroidobacteraceae bacterium]